MMVAAPSLRDQRSPVPSEEQAALTRGPVEESWFSSADNPFLTEEQSRERRLRAAVARVEEVIRRRPDVREVTILARTADGRTGHISAVATIAMRLPPQLSFLPRRLETHLHPNLHATSSEPAGGR